MVGCWHGVVVCAGGCVVVGVVYCALRCCYGVVVCGVHAASEFGACGVMVVVWWGWYDTGILCHSVAYVILRWHWVAWW